MTPCGRYAHCLAMLFVMMVQGVSLGLAQSTVVASGESLLKVSQRTQVSVAELIALNRLTEGYLYQGDVLFTAQPPGAVWLEQPIVIAAGDTLGRIATRHFSNVEAIMQANNLQHSRLIVGGTLMVPTYVEGETANPQEPAEVVQAEAEVLDTPPEATTTDEILLDEVAAEVTNEAADEIAVEITAEVTDEAADEITAEVTDEVAAEVTDEVEETPAEVVVEVIGEVSAEVTDDIPVEVAANQQSSLRESETALNYVAEGQEAEPLTWVYVSIVEGDALYTLAQEYGVSVAELKQWNGLQSNLIYVGDALRIASHPEAPIPSHDPLTPQSGDETASTPLTAPISPPQLLASTFRDEDTRDAAVLTLFPNTSHTPKGTSTAPLVLASKSNWSNELLSEMLAQLLKAHGYRVEQHYDLGNALSIRDYLLRGEVDLYVGHTGQVLQSIFKQHSQLELPQELLKAKEAATVLTTALDSYYSNLAWLCPAPADERYVIAAQRRWSDQHEISNLTELAAYMQHDQAVNLISSGAYLRLEGGLATLEAHYDMTFPTVILLSELHELQPIQALLRERERATVAMTTSTDPYLAHEDVVLLEDVLGAHTSRHPSPVVREAVLQAHPDLQQVLCAPFGALDNLALHDLKQAAQQGNVTSAVTAFLQDIQALP